MKVAEVLDVEIKPEDINISHKLFSEGEKSVIVKFISHKIKSKLYKKRTGLKNIKVSDIFQNATSARLSSRRKKNLHQWKSNILSEKSSQKSKWKKKTGYDRKCMDFRW